MEYQTTRAGRGTSHRRAGQPERSAPGKRARARGDREIPERFRQFWTDPKTTVRERKRAVRLVIEDVTVSKTDHIVAHIRFKGGATQTITVALPPPFAQSRLTAPETLAEMDRLLEEHTDAEVAEQLNQRGYRTFDGLLFQSIHVYQLRRHHIFQIGTPAYGLKVC